MRRLVLWWRFSRPFTLLPPALGMVSGAVTAIGSSHGADFSGSQLGLNIALGALVAGGLNAASNILNQIEDLEIDRINKPTRPLVTGTISIREAWWLAAVLYVLTIGASALISLPCLLLVWTAALFTWAYSCPPLRTKRWGIGANVTIAIPRGVMLKVAGWSCAAGVLYPEPWYIGSIFGLFLLGASTTKDFADIAGDRAGGCKTLPVVYGVRKAAWMIAPFFVLPFLMIPIGVWTGILTPRAPWAAIVFGGTLIVWGCYTAWLILRDPDALAATENHPSWTHMYLMMMWAQIGFAVAYLV